MLNNIRSWGCSAPQRSNLQLEHRDTCFTDGSMKHFSASQRWMLKHFGSWSREQRGQKTHTHHTLWKWKKKYSFPLHFSENLISSTLGILKETRPTTMLHIKARTDSALHTYLFASNSGKIYSTFRKRFIYRVSAELQKMDWDRSQMTFENLDR